mmetsp:Transcript_37290/g.79505  ORF Transcript_37290/g.79505 Transcript_37290/m.79505 type:complete len:174 (+) Transcript_37290:144-665(+)
MNGPVGQASDTNHIQRNEIESFKCKKQCLAPGTIAEISSMTCGILKCHSSTKHSIIFENTAHSSLRNLAPGVMMKMTRVIKNGHDATNSFSQERPESCGGGASCCCFWCLLVSSCRVKTVVGGGYGVPPPANGFTGLHPSKHARREGRAKGLNLKGGKASEERAARYATTPPC